MRSRCDPRFLAQAHTSSQVHRFVLLFAVVAQFGAADILAGSVELAAATSLKVLSCTGQDPIIEEVAGPIDAHCDGQSNTGTLGCDSVHHIHSEYFGFCFS